MGSKRGKEEGSFVRETRRQIFDFHRDLVQTLNPWQARTPKLREVEPEIVLPAEPEEAVASNENVVHAPPTLEPPPFTADPRDPGEGRDPSAYRAS
jgi:hypothetical protein